MPDHVKKKLSLQGHFSVKNYSNFPQLKISVYLPLEHAKYI